MKKETKKKVKEKPEVKKEKKSVAFKKEMSQPEPTQILHEQELKTEPEIKEEEVIEIKNEAAPEENISVDTPPIQEAVKHRGRHWKR